MQRKIFILFSLLFMSIAGSLCAGMPGHPLIKKTRQERFPRLQFAEQKGAQFELTPDGKTFYLLWLFDDTMVAG